MLTMKIFTWFFGTQVGQDSFGNCYYQYKYPSTRKRPKRWVFYKGMAEPSKVPASWHRWLHYTTDDVPLSHNTEAEKHHQPNLTGTVYAMKPCDHKHTHVPTYHPWKPL